MITLFTEDNKLTIARLIKSGGVKPTTANVQAVITRLRRINAANFEQDIQDVLNEDEDSL